MTQLESMTTKDASEYAMLVQEIALDHRQLENLHAERSVWAGNVQALAALSEMQDIIEDRIQRNTARCERFEAWLSAIDDPVMQRLIFSRFVESQSWVEIGRSERMKPDTARRAVTRFMLRCSE